MGKQLNRIKGYASQVRWCVVEIPGVERWRLMVPWDLLVSQSSPLAMP